MHNALPAQTCQPQLCLLICRLLMHFSSFGNIACTGFSGMPGAHETRSERSVAINHHLLLTVTRVSQSRSWSQSRSSRSHLARVSFPSRSHLFLISIASRSHLTRISVASQSHLARISRASRAHLARISFTSSSNLARISHVTRSHLVRIFLIHI